MREPAFVHQNKEKWSEFERLLSRAHRVSPDRFAELFLEITDDLAYARTYYPNSQVTQYLNSIAVQVHQSIYKNKRESSNRLKEFWLKELPYIFYKNRKSLILSFLVFFGAFAMGAFSAAYEESFLRFVLSDQYVSMTIDNIKSGNPTGVYQKSSAFSMFIRIMINNVQVSFLAFIMGIFAGFGTFYILFTNGMMIGSFIYFFYKYDAFGEAMKTIWLHGTPEIIAIIIAGMAGFLIGKSILFPRTYSRLNSFMRGTREGVKVIIGLVPLFIFAAFIEGFITRHGPVIPWVFSLVIILSMLFSLLYYLFVYPHQLYGKSLDEDALTVDQYAG